ncbi:zinc finger domain-containing protein [Apiospora marii]|uniref:zinc finger domain-containing protein n=1 Tax=Apiospora marii TaxID=335849 RepID=UPI00312FBF19
MADQQEKQEKKGPRGLIGAILANKRKREAAEDAHLDAILSRPVVRTVPADRTFSTGSHRRLEGRASTVEQAVSLIHRYRDEQPGGVFPADTNITIFQPNPMHIAASRRPIEDQRAPARRPKAKPISAPPPPPPPPPSESMDGDKEEPARKKRKRSNRGNKKRHCGWCGEPGHEVLDCAGPPAEDGYIHACPVHNTSAHTGAECRKSEGWDLGQRWDYQVVQRRHLPPLAYERTWERIAWEYLTKPGVDTASIKADALPLTAGFSKTIDKAKFYAYDYAKGNTEGQLGCQDRISTVGAFLSWADTCFAPIRVGARTIEVSGAPD